MKAEYKDHMGSDLSVVNDARVSFDKESEWEEIWETEEVNDPTFGKIIRNKSVKHVLKERDRKLINYLATHGHWTPFSHVMIKMRETVPFFVARQRFKHFVGFNSSGDHENDHEGLGTAYNEVSRRYVSDTPEFFMPDSWRIKADNKKQGSSNEILTGIHHTDIHVEYEQFVKDAESLYEHMLLKGVAPEQARIVLPQSTMTSYVVTGSLPAWARAYKLRNHGDAQKEIVNLAQQWDQIISNIPELKHSWKALKGEE